MSVKVDAYFAVDGCHDGHLPCFGFAWQTTQWIATTVLLLFVFVVRRLHERTWPGWSFVNNVTKPRVVTFLKLYSPAALQFASEFWRYFADAGALCPHSGAHYCVPS